MSYKVLIIGYGSIGQRHYRIFENLGHQVAVLSRRASAVPMSYKKLNDAIEQFGPDFVVIATETSDHYQTLEQIKKIWKGQGTLIEKPIFAHVPSIDLSNSERDFVAYNLRFNPLLVKLKELIRDQVVISANIYCGQFLPSWRPDSDYRKSYSAKKTLGGGVARDLSHEIDYCTWLFGKFKSLVAISEKLSDLEIESEDSFSLIGKTERSRLVSLNLNYIDREAQRLITVNTTKSTYVLNLIEGVLREDGKVIYQEKIVRDYTYVKQAEAFLGGDQSLLCSFSEGVHVLKVIEAAEKSSQERCWVNL